MGNFPPIASPFCLPASLAQIATLQGTVPLSLNVPRFTGWFSARAPCNWLLRTPGIRPKERDNFSPTYEVVGLTRQLGSRRSSY